MKDKEKIVKEILDSLSEVIINTFILFKRTEKSTSMIVTIIKQSNLDEPESDLII